MASDTRMRVARFENWVDPVFDTTLEARPEIEFRRLRFSDPRRVNLDALARTHVLHLSPTRDELPPEWLMTEHLLAECPALLCVSSGGAGYDTIDVDACTQAGVAVVNQAGGNAVSVAEHTMGLILSVLHRIAESDRTLRGKARGFSRQDLTGRELAGKVLGLVGIGHIGTRVAALGKAFGMTVLATDPYLDRQEVERRGATPVSLLSLLRDADVVSLHCPLLPSTLKMMDAAAFEAMKPGAVFITTARGGIHDEDALHQALASGHLAGAGLDVWDIEPPSTDNRLLTHATVVGTFHTAGVTHEARRNVAQIAAEQILRLADAGKPPRLINPTVWSRYRERFERTFGDVPPA